MKILLFIFFSFTFFSGYSVANSVDQRILGHWEVKKSLYTNVKGNEEFIKQDKYNGVRYRFDSQGSIFINDEKACDDENSEILDQMYKYFQPFVSRGTWNEPNRIIKPLACKDSKGKKILFTDQQWFEKDQISHGCLDTPGERWDHPTSYYVVDSGTIIGRNPDGNFFCMKRVPEGAPNKEPEIALSVSSETMSGAIVILDASLTSDEDGDSLKFTWSQTSGPSVSIEGKDTSKAMFVAPEVVVETNLSFKIQVEDLFHTVTKEVAVKVVAKQDQIVENPQTCSDILTTKSLCESNSKKRCGKFEKLANRCEKWKTCPRKAEKARLACKSVDSPKKQRKCDRRTEKLNKCLDERRGVIKEKILDRYKKAIEKRFN